MMRDRGIPLAPNIIGFEEFQDQQASFFEWLEKTSQGDPGLAQTARHFYSHFAAYVLPADQPTGILAVNKPANLHTYSGYTPTMFGTVEIARLAAKNRCIESLHRLDRETSGVLLLGKTVPIRAQVRGAFEEKRVFKEYLAIVHGTPNPQIAGINIPILTQDGGYSQIDTSEKARPAQTAVETLAELIDLKTHCLYSVLRIRIFTGRTHQIRVHTSQALGTPIVGDKLYNNIPPQAERQLLHAYKLTILEPQSKKNLRFTASPPADFQEFLRGKEITMATTTFFDIFSPVSIPA